MKAEVDSESIDPSEPMDDGNQTMVNLAKSLEINNEKKAAMPSNYETTHSDGTKEGAMGRGGFKEKPVQA